MTREIRDIIERVVRERFTDGVIAVHVTSETDYEGADVFRVTVVLDDKAIPLDSQKTAGVVRHIRHQLLAKDEDTFPILSFVSKSDAKRMGTAAA